jgi:hypothetical protein
MLVANTDQTNQYFAYSRDFHPGSEELDGNFKGTEKLGHLGQFYLSEKIFGIPFSRLKLYKIQII